MPPERILILGGTREARELATALLAEGYDVVTSLAGATREPLLPQGRVRLGGFGGTDGLVRYLHDENIATIADATHPFAAQMSAQASAAAAIARLPLLRIERPMWQPQPGDRWIAAETLEAAAALLPPGARAMLTTGRKGLELFLARSDVTGIARMIENPGFTLPPGWELILDRPPYSLAAERDLIARHAVTHVVSKNAGGADTSAKIGAARQAGIQLVMIARPHKPDATVVSTVKDFIPSLRRVLLP